MTKILTGVGLLAVIAVAQAHDSWAPHTHTIENGHSDLFYIAIAGIVASLLAGFSLKALARRREAMLARVPKPSVVSK